jgi:hypothetical protein
MSRTAATTTTKPNIAAVKEKLRKSWFGGLFENPTEPYPTILALQEKWAGDRAPGKCLSESAALSRRKMDDDEQIQSSYEFDGLLSPSEEKFEGLDDVDGHWPDLFGEDSGLQISVTISTASNSEAVPSADMQQQHEMEVADSTTRNQDQFTHSCTFEQTFSSGQRGNIHVEVTRSNPCSRSNTADEIVESSGSFQDEWSEALEKISSQADESVLPRDEPQNDEELLDVNAEIVMEDQDSIIFPDPDDCYRDARTSSDRPYPTVSKFTITSISTASGQLFPSLIRRKPLINLDGLAQHFQQEGGAGLIRAVTAHAELADLKRDRAPAKRARIDGSSSKVLKVVLVFPPGSGSGQPGGDELCAAVWRNGTAQITGAPHLTRVTDSFAAIRAWILDAGAAVAGLSPDAVADAAGDCGAVLKSVSFRGGWDCGFEAAGVQLDKAGLCRFLTNRYIHHVAEAKMSASETAAARFQQALRLPPPPSPSLHTPPPCLSACSGSAEADC